MEQQLQTSVESAVDQGIAAAYGTGKKADPAPCRTASDPQCHMGCWKKGRTHAVPEKAVQSLFSGYADGEKERVRFLLISKRSDELRRGHRTLAAHTVPWMALIHLRLRRRNAHQKALMIWSILRQV